MSAIAAVAMREAPNIAAANEQTAVIKAFYRVLVSLIKMRRHIYCSAAASKKISAGCSCSFWMGLLNDELYRKRAALFL